MLIAFRSPFGEAHDSGVGWRRRVGLKIYRRPCLLANRATLPRRSWRRLSEPFRGGPRFWCSVYDSGLVFWPLTQVQGFCFYDSVLGFSGRPTTLVQGFHDMMVAFRSPFGEAHDSGVALRVWGVGCGVWGVGCVV